jgi:hypothetical protein
MKGEGFGYNGKLQELSSILISQVWGMGSHLAGHTVPLSTPERKEMMINSKDKTFLHHRPYSSTQALEKGAVSSFLICGGLK